LTAADQKEYRFFDLAELWHRYTGLGFVFAMWMTGREETDIDFAAARDEGLAHLDEIAENFSHSTGVDSEELKLYLSQNISFQADDAMQQGMDLYFALAAKNGLIPRVKPLRFTGPGPTGISKASRRLS
jgi:chorismate dehydratase